MSGFTQQQSPHYIQVILPVPKYQTFTYRVPQTWKQIPQMGQLVRVPLGRRELIGMVEGFPPSPPEGVKELKDVLEILPSEYSLSDPLLKLFHWAQRHYLAPPGEVLRTFFPTRVLQGKWQLHFRVRSLVPNIESLKTAPIPELLSEQTQVVNEVKSHHKEFYPLVLEGITGSGKTEVYLRLCDEFLQVGGGTLILVPEIGLTPQMVGRFVARFGNQVGLFHSGLTEAQRLKTWWETKTGRQNVLIGTRSAIALPVKNLSLIVIDEEHDSSYKQEERFRYHARDLGVVRAKLEQIPIVLGSATPSLESQNNVQIGKYHHARLTRRASEGSLLPEVQLIDLRKERPHSETLLSPSLETAIQNTLDRGEQVLLFLNRRGFAPTVLCEECGQALECPNCEISLTFHQRIDRLKCHYCEFQQPSLKQCPRCQSFTLSPLGFGTERIEKAFSKLYPHAQIGRLDRDVVQSQQRTESLLSQFEQGKIDLLIGTQLVTKGHDFSKLTLVGILLADLGLHLPDFRAAERVYQMVTQVAGRAGRRGLPGKVYVQTFRPEHFALQACLSQNGVNFFTQENAHRKESGYPPWTRLVQIQFSGRIQNLVQKVCRQFSQQLQEHLKTKMGIKILGPAPALLEKIRGKYRWQILIKTSQYEQLRQTIEDFIPQLNKGVPRAVQWAIDVDPMGIY